MQDLNENGLNGFNNWRPPVSKAPHRGSSKGYKESHVPSHIANQVARRRIEDINSARDLGMSLKEYCSI